MLTREEFKHYFDIFNKKRKFEEKLYALGIDIYELDSEMRFEDAFVELLSLTMDDNIDNSFGSNCMYFIYELDCGKSNKAFECITDENGNTYSLRTVDELYDYLTLNSKEAVQEKNAANNLKNKSVTEAIKNINCAIKTLNKACNIVDNCDELSE